MASSASVVEAKKALRKAMKKLLSNLSENDIFRQSAAAQNVVLRTPQYRDATRISIYLSMPSGEAQTEMLVHDALSLGKTVFVPYIHKVVSRESAGKGGSSIMDMLELRSIGEWNSLSRDAWGIPSLDPNTVDDRANALGGHGLSTDGEYQRGTGSKDSKSAPSTFETRGLDLIVVPGVAFDPGMHRLGHGAGFYDKYLSRLTSLNALNTPYLLGLCLAEQLLPTSGQVPTTNTDWQMHAIATGDGRLVTPDI